VLSLGTNTVRLLIIEDGPGDAVEQIEHLAVGTRLGEGLREDGSLSDAAMHRTLEAARTFTEAARRHGAMIYCIATSAMRRAKNASVFAERLREVTGAPLRVIGGEEEAAASFRGATYGGEVVDAGMRIAVLDIGGGSTECAVGAAGVPEDAVSLEVGTVRLTERFPELNGSRPGVAAFETAQRAHAFVRERMRTLERFLPPRELRAVAGTPATIAAIITSGDVEHVRGVALSRADVRAVADRLLNASLEERRAIPGMLAQRADVLAAGAIVLDTAMEVLACAEARVETNDLLLGYALAARHLEQG
jgi:exopolyphosphatase/guanosine-5'-triphosphate,3'-diphosphate pyrophosphatase